MSAIIFVLPRITVARVPRFRLLILPSTFSNSMQKTSWSKRRDETRSQETDTKCAIQYVPTCCDAGNNTKHFEAFFKVNSRISFEK